MDKNLILGVGNILLADEGFGIRALEYLRENYAWPEDADLVDGGTRGLALLAELMEHDFVAVLDIVKGGQAPGTFYLLEEGDLAKSFSLRQSMHQINLEDALISCELAGHRPKAVVFGFEPFNYQTLDPNLTVNAARLLPAFCGKVVEELAKMGIVAVKK